MARTYRIGILRKLVNALLGLSVRTGIGPGQTYLLTTIGRRSGRARTTPVNLLEFESERWIVAPYGARPWVLNVRSAGTAEIRRGRRRETLTFEEVDATTAGPVLHAYLRETPITAPYFDAEVGDPVERFIAEAPSHPVFRVTSVGGAT